MADIDRERARARAKAKAMAVPQPQQQKEQPKQEPSWWDKNIRGNSPELEQYYAENRPQNPEMTNEEKRGFASTSAGLLGSLLGSPVSGAAAYTLTDQLLNKYLEGKEITPMSTAKSAGIGLAQEVLPKAVLNQIGRMIPKDAARNWMRGAFGAGKYAKPEDLEQAIDTALENQYTVSPRGLGQAQKNVTPNFGKALEREAQLAEQGATINPKDVLNKTKANLNEKYKSWSSEDMAAANEKWVDTALEKKYAEKLGRNYDQGTLRFKEIKDLPIDKAIEQRRNLDNMLAEEFNKRRISKSGRGSFSENKASKFMAEADALRSEINKDEILARYNDLMHKDLNFMNFAGDRLQNYGKGALIPSEIMLPAIIESAYRGGPQVATALGALRWGSKSPYLRSTGALGLQSLQKQRAQNYIPEIYKTQYLNNLYDMYNPTAYAEDLNKKKVKRGGE